ncbi:MAG TPA: glycosyl hydrolase [Prolixibacteraceae bacterium]|jgi:endoglucanase Acf2
MKRKNFTFGIFTFILLLGLVFPGVVWSQIVTVGGGSYTTVLPPADAAGRNVNPTGKPRVSGAAISKPIATSDWWTGLLTFDGAILYNYPLTMKGVPAGLVMSYTFLGLGANDSRQPMSPDQPLVLGVSGLNATYPTVSDYSDWTVTASWISGEHTFNATMGMGMPFVYCTKGSADVASVTINLGTVTIQNEMILITNSLSKANFAVYAPLGSTWTKTGSTYTSTLNGKNYFSAVMLPAASVALTVANDWKQYAYVFPTNTSVDWTYDNASSSLKTTFTVTADQKEGSGSNVLLGLLPHQWAHLSASSPQPGSYNYTTSRGLMKMLPSNTFIVENKFRGILSTLPNMAKYSQGFDPGALNAKIDQVKGAGLDLWTDSYNDGLAMNRLIQVARIADQMGNTEARDQIVKTVRERLENWFKAVAGENAFLFSYNKTWTTLIGYPAGYSSDANLNDHHFHYGYFISAAAAIEQFQPGWASQWGGMVELLAKDVANGDRTDTRYPFLRTFNPYEGHSFASGLLNNEPHGNNQECSSEAMNFNSSLINWGILTGNTALRDLGIYLYTTEQTAIEEYWFDMSNRNFSASYLQMMCSRVWGNGYDRGTFWTGDIAAMYGIEMFPLTGASLYLGQNIPYVKQLWTDMKSKTAVLAKTPNDNLWYDVYWSYLALADPATAITLYNDYPGYKVKGGCSDAQTYHWLHSFNGMGQMDATMTADYPIAAVFNKAGNKTYVAHNYGTEEITVTYSDGYKMPVPGRTMKTSKDLDITALLVSSASQVAANGSTTLSATTTGSGITKVEFYDGLALIGTSSEPPYSVVANNLAAKIHGFYAKVYVDASVQLSNVVAVTVGSQLAYKGTPVSIPLQAIEAGNYDYFEGGIGQNISYFDATSWNDAGTFRSPEYVDAGPTTGEGNTVGWVDNGEWLEYTVNIAQAGTYDLTFRYTSGNAAGGGPFHLEVDGITVAANIMVGFTGSTWNTWASKTITGVVLPAGEHVIRFAFDKGGFNLGKTTFTYKGTTGLSELERTAIKVYPNPANNVLFIEGLTKESMVSIFGVSGQMIVNKLKRKSQFDINDLPRGIYTVQITDLSGIITRKFIKQ